MTTNAQFKITEERDQLRDVDVDGKWIKVPQNNVQWRADINSLVKFGVHKTGNA